MKSEKTTFLSLFPDGDLLIGRLPWLCLVFFLNLFTVTLLAQQPAANLDQVRNGSAAAPVDPGEWGNGNAGSSNSHYAEGMSIPYRVVMTNLPASTTVTLVLEYDVKHSGRHAIDFLTHYDRLEPHELTYNHSDAEEIDPTIGTIFAGDPGTDTEFIPEPPVLNPPPDVPNQPADAWSDIQAGAFMSIWNATFADTDPITYGPAADLSNDKEPQQINVSFVTGPSGGTVILAWGGHIGSRNDWGFDEEGIPRSAGGISGSPYHMRLIDWNLNNLGNQDRSLSADAVTAPPECILDGPANVCAGSQNAYAVEVSNTMDPTYTWSFVGDPMGATIEAGQGTSEVTVQAGAGGSSYTIEVVIAAINGMVSCSETVMVDTAPTAAAGTDQEACADGNGTTTFSLTGTVTDGTPSWSVVSTTGTASPAILSANAENTDVDITGTGSVTLRITSNSINTCPDASDDLTLTVYPTLTAAAGLDQSACEDESGTTTFSLMGQVTNGTPQWSVIGTTGTASPTIQTPDGANTDVDITGTGTVTLELRSASSTDCPDATDGIILTVYPELTAAAGTDQALCEEESGTTTFSLTGSVTNGTPQWSVVGTTGTASPSIQTPQAEDTDVEVTGTGTVTLRLTSLSATDCPDATDDIVLTVYTELSANAGTDQDECQDPEGTTIFNLTGSVNGGNPAWAVIDMTGTAAANIVASNAENTDVEITGTGTITLRLTANSTTDCPSAMDDIILTVYPRPTATAGMDQDECQDPVGTTIFEVSGSVTDGAPVWSVFNTTGTADASILSPNSENTAVEVTGTGMVVLRLTATSATECTDATDDVVLVVYPELAAAAGMDQAKCADGDGTTTFSLSGLATNGSAAWSVINTTGTADAAILSPNTQHTNVDITGTGTVTLRLTATNPTECPDASDDIVLTVYPELTAAAGKNQQVCADPDGTTTFSLHGSVVNGAPMWSVVGTTGTASATIQTPDAEATDVDVTGTGTVTLKLTAISSTNCPNAMDNIILSIHSEAVAAAGMDQEDCVGEAGPKTFSLSGSVTNGTPAWSVLSSTGTASASILSPGAESTDVEVSGTGSVTLRLTANSNADCPDGTDDLILTVHPLPTVAITAAGPVCADQAPLQLQATANPEGGSGIWSGPGVDASGLFDPTVAGIGDHLITYTYTGPFECENSHSITVSVVACDDYCTWTPGFWKNHPAEICYLLGGTVSGKGKNTTCNGGSSISFELCTDGETKVYDLTAQEISDLFDLSSSDQKDCNKGDYSAAVKSIACHFACTSNGHALLHHILATKLNILANKAGGTPVGDLVCNAEDGYEGEVIFLPGIYAGPNGEESDYYVLFDNSETIVACVPGGCSDDNLAKLYSTFIQPLTAFNECKDICGLPSKEYDLVRIETPKYMPSPGKKTVKKDMRVYPNPTKDDLTISYESPRAAQGVIRIYNISGKLQMEFQRELMEGNNLVELQVDQLVNGMYTVQVYDGEQFTGKRFIVSKF